MCEKSSIAEECQRKNEELKIARKAFEFIRKMAPKRVQTTSGISSPRRITTEQGEASNSQNTTTVHTLGMPPWTPTRPDPVPQVTTAEPTSTIQTTNIVPSAPQTSTTTEPVIAEIISEPVTQQLTMSNALPLAPEIVPLSSTIVSEPAIQPNTIQIDDITDVQYTRRLGKETMLPQTPVIELPADMFRYMLKSIFTLTEKVGRLQMLHSRHPIAVTTISNTNPYLLDGRFKSPLELPTSAPERMYQLNRNDRSSYQGAQRNNSNAITNQQHMMNHIPTKSETRMAVSRHPETFEEKIIRMLRE